MDSLILSVKKAGENKYWQPNQKILLAVSGGLDSMVLLHIVQELQREFQFSLAVAHVNHQLRKESLAEEHYLQLYCQKNQLPFFATRWEQPVDNGMEAAAREFRYRHFKQIMMAEGYQLLMTAHHQDDQAETFLMKLIRGGDFRGHIGIVSERVFGTGKLVRPLLQYPKQRLLEYAEKHQLDYFEDASNQVPVYQRNRMRLQLLPKIKLENTRAVDHISQFSQQLSWASELIEQQMATCYQGIVEERTGSYHLKSAAIEKLSEGEQYFFWEYFFQLSLKKNGIGAKQKQLLELLQLFEAPKAQWQLSFEQNWVLKKEYQQLVFYQKKQAELPVDKPIKLSSEGLYLNETQWLAVVPKGQQLVVPEKTADWLEFQQEFPAGKQAGFSVRKRQPGDRIQLQKNLRKRVSRYLIDEKIPSSIREKSWLLLNEQQEVLALLPHLFSYLSNAEETDTIQYTLIYRYKG